MDHGGVDTLLIQGQQSLKAAEVRPQRRHILLLHAAGQQIQHHVLACNNKMMVPIGAGDEPPLQFGGFDLGGRTLMAGSGNVLVHILLGKAHLAPHPIGVDLPPANQFIDGVAAHMEHRRHLLGGQGLLVGHGSPSSFT